jgi:hypothetical protein
MKCILVRKGVPAPSEHSTADSSPSQSAHSRRIRGALFWWALSIPGQKRFPLVPSLHSMVPTPATHPDTSHFDTSRPKPQTLSAHILSTTNIYALSKRCSALQSRISHAINIITSTSHPPVRKFVWNRQSLQHPSLASLRHTLPFETSPRRPRFDLGSSPPPNPNGIDCILLRITVISQLQTHSRLHRGIHLPSLNSKIVNVGGSRRRLQSSSHAFSAYR